MLLIVSIARVTTSQPLRISFLDVGQGDAILIQTPSGHDMLIDGGPTNNVLTRLNEVMSYLDRDIDIVVATHPDSDHVTGLIPVLEKYTAHHILTSGQESETGIFKNVDEVIIKENVETRIAYQGDVIDFRDGVTAQVLHPLVGEKFKDTNAASVSLVLTYGSMSFLLTGDLPSTNEPLLISSGLLPNHVTVYKAAHHGSKYSSGEQLLTYIKPEYAVISAGKDNTYGHPNSEAIERLQMYSKEILSTIDRGTITFITDGRSIEVESEK